MRLPGLLTAAWLGLAAMATAEPAISVKGNAIQGYPLFVQVEGEPGVEAQAQWAGQTYALGKSDAQGRLRALLAVPVEATGTQKLTVQLGDQQLSRSYTIAPRRFRLQHVTLSPATLDSYSDPQNRADDEAILRAARKPGAPVQWKGNFRLPVQAPESTEFGARRLYNGWKKGWHKGLDLAGWEGQAIHAPAAGKVVHTARGVVNGNTVVLSHGAGLVTVYLHMHSVAVDQGETVEAGQVLGTVGGTGGFSPHLHWEARVWGVPIDPKSLFQMPPGWR